MAQGSKWKPIAQHGRLDWHYYPTPTQWLDGLPMTMAYDRLPRELTWITSFDLSGTSASLQEESPAESTHTTFSPVRPELDLIFQAFLDRVAALGVVGHKPGTSPEMLFKEEESVQFIKAREMARKPALSKPLCALLFPAAG